MNVLGLASYPTEAAATRFRLEQFVQPLAARGINLTIRPFMNSQLFTQFYGGGTMTGTAIKLLKSSVLRFADVIRGSRADVILVQREAMLIGPPVIEWLLSRALKRPLVLDLDDATYVSYTSPTYGWLGRLKWFGKTNDLIRWARIVTCGNRSIAEYVSSKGSTARIIPTIVDTQIFRPAPRASDGPPVLGWIGTHSTFPYLESIFPVLQDLAKANDFKLKIVGAGKTGISIPGVEVENLPWRLDREVEDFQSVDIGLYPIDAALYSGNWAAGKSGFKALQYMAVGVPYVATPVGASAEIGEAGVTHFAANDNYEWHGALSKLLEDQQLRKRMGAAGREHVLENYGLEAQADKLAGALREAAGR